MSRPQNSFQTLPRPKNSPLALQKVKNDPIIKSNSKVRFEEIIENESCSTIWVHPKTVGEPYTNLKNSPLGAKKKSKMTPKLSKNSYQNWRKHTKWKLNNYMSRPQNSFRTLSNPRNSPLGPKKSKMTPTLSQNQMPELKET